VATRTKAAVYATPSRQSPLRVLLSLVPTGRALLLFVAAAALYALSSLSPGLGLVAIAAHIGMVLALLADGLLAARPAELVLARESPAVLPLGVPVRIRIVVESEARLPATVLLRDDPPESCEAADEPGPGVVPAGGSLILEYELVARRRGRGRFGDLHLRVLGPLGLLWRQSRRPAPGAVRVFPDFRGMSRYGALARRRALELLGARPARRRGGGTEFEALRPYYQGDDVRRMDWKATAKRGRPIVREYREERSQRVVLVLDSGRRMLARVGGQAKFDHALHAALGVAHVAEAYGDRVGCMAYAEQVVKLLPPERSPGAARRLAHLLYDVEPRAVEPDLNTALAQLAMKSRKRALLVLFTDLADEDSARQMLKSLSVIGRRHLPVCVLLRDEDVVELARRIPRTIDEVYERAVAADLLEGRRKAIRALRRHGVLVADVPASEAGATAVSAYLEIKAQGRL